MTDLAAADGPKRTISAQLTVVPTSVRDIAIPLGGFANIVVAHSAPASFAVSSRRVCSVPAVLLPQGSEAALPRTGCSLRRPGTTHQDLLSALAAEPLCIELLHHDKYCKDVLLGVATVELSEVLSARPSAVGRRTVLEQEQTVPFIAPNEAPAEIAEDYVTESRNWKGRRPVALLNVTLRLEYADDPTPLPKPPKPQPRPAEAARAKPVSPAREVETSASDKVARAAAAKQAGAQPSSSSAKADAKLRVLQEQKLRQLEREWRVREAKRVAGARAQARVLAEATQQLQHGLAQLATQDDMLHITADELALRGAALERQAEVERAEHAQALLERQRATEAALARAAASHAAEIKKLSDEAEMRAVAER